MFEKLLANNRSQRSGGQGGSSHARVSRRPCSCAWGICLDINKFDQEDAPIFLHPIFHFFL